MTERGAAMNTDPKIYVLLDPNIAQRARERANRRGLSLSYVVDEMLRWDLLLDESTMFHVVGDRTQEGC